MKMELGKNSGTAWGLNAGVTGLWVLLVLCCVPGVSWAYEGVCERPSARVESVQGRVEVQNAANLGWVTVALGDVVCPGDSIRVRHNARAALSLTIPQASGNENTLRLDQNTTVTFPSDESASWLRMPQGVVHFISRLRHSFSVLTPFTNAGVDGTEFVVAVSETDTVVTVLEGHVKVESDAGEAGKARIGSGQAVQVGADGLPLVRDRVNPQDAVQWALYYPPVISFSSDIERLVSGAPAHRAVIEQSVAAVNKGELQNALDLLVQAGVEPQGADLYVYRAALYLNVGRVAQARADLDKALSINPQQANALALLSIIAVAQNDNATALRLAQQAIGADPRDASAGLALSYARQAQFDLDGAVKAIEEAVRYNPRDTLARIRMAELYLSQGELERALVAARAARAINSRYSRGHSVLGFAFLTQYKTEAAQLAFARAIELDSADPLPRLGRGLALIRNGELEKGRHQIEIAVSLDPNNALIRSYLGKAYFEEDREQVSSVQLDMAKRLDPKDPTPWFYDAIRKQSLNRPVEALADLQKSIALNDNRAVYRSKLLLDSDLAARSASLGRIYKDLGFQQLALVEGWKSVNTNPGDYSAHRFLADSYSTLPRHKIARVSELLQAQLLQPINVNPLQPQLAEANLGILDGAGPSEPAFNEFNPLFVRNRTAFQVDRLVAGNNTQGVDAVLSGLHNSFSYSLGRYYYETDGWRENAFREQGLSNLFAQMAFTNRTSAQVELRTLKKDQGDVSMNFFDATQFSSSLHEKENKRVARFGLRHQFSPQSDLLASVIYSRSVSDTDGRFIVADSSAKSALAELQYLQQSGSVNWVSGLGYSDDNEHLELAFFGFPDPPLDFKTKHENYYIYGHYTPADVFTATLGLSVDKVEDKSLLLDDTQINPKLGLTLIPFRNTVIRAAAFRTLVRSMPTFQTLEPTQVAGFGQFFDEYFGTDSKNYGLALDQGFGGRVKAGVELKKRALDIPYTNSNILEYQNWDEATARAYVYYVPHKNVSSSLEFYKERIETDKLIGNAPLELDTDRLAFGLNGFFPSGLILKGKLSYVRQDGLFVDSSGFSRRGEDKFWVLDSELAYRLPRQWGMIALGGKNLLDETFQYQELDPENALFYPERLVYTRLSVSF